MNMNMNMNMMMTQQQQQQQQEAVLGGGEEGAEKQSNKTSHDCSSKVIGMQRSHHDYIYPFLFLFLALFLLLFLFVL